MFLFILGGIVFLSGVLLPLFSKRLWALQLGLLIMFAGCVIMIIALFPQLPQPATDSVAVPVSIEIG